MERLQKIKQLFCSAVIFQFLMSASILLMPMATKIGQQDGKIKLLLGLVFWLSAIAGYALVVMANSERKRLINQKIDGNVKTNHRLGIVSFFTNAPATVADVIMIISLLLFVVVNFTKWKYEYISYIILFVFIFSLHMHCMFNGIIYKAIKIKRTRRESSYE